MAREQQSAAIAPGEVRLSKGLEEAVKASVAMSVQGVKDSQETFIDEDTGGKLKRMTGHIPAPMQPKPGTREMSLAAAGALSKYKREERQKLNKSAPESWKGIVSYIECPDSSCQGPGIWILGDPRVELSEKNWLASYHPIGAYWAPDRVPHCQCCLEAHGVRRPLRGIQHIGIGNPNNLQLIGICARERYVRTVDKDELSKALSPAEVEYLVGLAS